MGAAAEDEIEEHHAPKQPHLATQDASTVDPTKLTALTPEVVSHEMDRFKLEEPLYYIMYSLRV